MTTYAPALQLSILAEVPAKVAQPAATLYREREAILANMRRLHDALNSALEDPHDRPSIGAPADAYNLFYPSLATLDHEELHVMILDTRNRVLKIQKVYSGSLNTSLIRIGELFRAAIIENAAGIILAHNHPSGDPAPSPEDVAVTRACVEAGKLLDIECMDHLIIGLGRFVSLKERGLGFKA